MIRLHRSLTGALALIPLAGCVRNPQQRHEFEAPKVVQRDVPMGQNIVERYSDGRSARANPHAGGAAPSAGGAGAERIVAWDLPEGWREKPLTQYRLGSFEIPGGGDCSISRIGGGLVQNVNRWRKQFGLPATSQQAVRDLPRQRVSNSQGYLIEYWGDYDNTMGGQKIANAKLLGIVAPVDESVSLFLKFTGPADVVDANREKFFALSASLRPATMPAAAPSGDESGSTGGFDPRTLRWNIPADWEQKSGRQGRLVTVGPKNVADTQAWIIPLFGTAGGLQPNINRWRGEVQQPPLSSDEVAALPRIDVLGTQAPLLEVYGNYKGQNGEQTDGGLLGVSCPVGDYTLFIKMVGPADAIRAEKDRFIEFVSSLNIQS